MTNYHLGKEIITRWQTYNSIFYYSLLRGQLTELSQSNWEKILVNDTISYSSLYYFLPEYHLHIEIEEYVQIICDIRLLNAKRYEIILG